MKRFEYIFAILLIPIDALMLLLAATAAYSLRFENIVTQYRPVVFDIPFSSYIEIISPWIVVWIILFALTGLYTIGTVPKIFEQVKRILIASTIGFASITVAIFLQRTLFDSRFILLAAYLFAILFVIIGRIIGRIIRLYCFKRGIGSKRVLLIGDDKSAEIIKQYINQDYRYGMRLMHRLSSKNVDLLAEVKKKIKQGSIDLIFVSDSAISSQLKGELLELAQQNQLAFQYISDVYGASTANTELNTIAGLPLITIKRTPLDGWGRVYKRMFDTIVGTIMFVLFLPIMLIISILIKLDSKGPIIYKNQRVGKDGKFFMAYKFRRMKLEFNTGPGYDQDGKAEKIEQQLIKKSSHRSGPLYKIADDPRNTSIGSFLERSSLDELPQFLNVILGNMSLVGPRPHQPREVDKYSDHHNVLFTIKPGITGFAQISGRSDLDFEDEYRLDKFYIQNWSILLDLAILFKTPLVVFKKHK